jgi:hypothetical protein
MSFYGYISRGADYGVPLNDQEYRIFLWILLVSWATGFGPPLQQVGYIKKIRAKRLVPVAISHFTKRRLKICR